jgi:hypothetical protein
VCWAIRPHHDQLSRSRQRGPDAHTCHRLPVTRKLDHSRRPNRGSCRNCATETNATAVTVSPSRQRATEVGGDFRLKVRPHHDKLTPVGDVGRTAGESGTHRPAVKGATRACAANGVQWRYQPQMRWGASTVAAATQRGQSRRRVWSRAPTRWSAAIRWKLALPAQAAADHRRPAPAEHRRPGYGTALRPGCVRSPRRRVREGCS